MARSSGNVAWLGSWGAELIMQEKKINNKSGLMIRRLERPRNAKERNFMEFGSRDDQRGRRCEERAGSGCLPRIQITFLSDRKAN
jgi:hypothetical protein